MSKMTSQEAVLPAIEKEIQVPEWEHSAAVPEKDQSGPSNSRRSPWISMSNRLDSVMPPHRRYLRMSRRTFLFVLLALSLALLALIIGLAAGLTTGSKYVRRSYSTRAQRRDVNATSRNGQDLPLPSNTQTFTGDLTYYQPGLGACGFDNTASQDIVAVSEILFDAAGPSTADGGNPNDNPLCNMKLRASRYDEQYDAQRSVDLTVVDRCVGCAVHDLDVSLSAFTQLAPEVDGRVDVTWAWLQPVATGT